MIIFNTTFHLEDNIHEDFIDFLKKTYVPFATQSGFLHQPRLALIHRQHEENGISYSLQFHVKNTDTLNHWFDTDGQTLQKEIVKQFGNKAMGFITLMEEISL